MMAVKSLPMQTRAEQQGFTLAEMIIVVVILGVLAAASAVFIRGPVDAYFASARRAELSDIADTAMRRIGRDVRAALPNSVRVAGACNGAAACYLEYIPVVAGGRYRAELSSTGTGNPLDFGNNSDTSFDIIGPAISIPAAGTKWVAIYNLGITGADAYSGDAGAADVRRRYNGAGGAVSSISFVSATRFPFESPARRFQVVTSPVTYACAPAVAGGQLLRYEGYAFSARGAGVQRDGLQFFLYRAAGRATGRTGVDEPAAHQRRRASESLLPGACQQCPVTRSAASA
jgi:MSHA biogenesis protein MshO